MSINENIKLKTLRCNLNQEKHLDSVTVFSLHVKDWLTSSAFDHLSLILVVMCSNLGHGNMYESLRFCTVTLPRLVIGMLKPKH